jgi:hypothetical protein
MWRIVKGRQERVFGLIDCLLLFQRPERVWKTGSGLIAWVCVCILDISTSEDGAAGRSVSEGGQGRGARKKLVRGQSQEAQVEKSTITYKELP